MSELCPERCENRKSDTARLYTRPLGGTHYEGSTGE